MLKGACLELYAGLHNTERQTDSRPSGLSAGSCLRACEPHELNACSPPPPNCSLLPLPFFGIHTKTKTHTNECRANLKPKWKIDLAMKRCVRVCFRGLERVCLYVFPEEWKITLSTYTPSTVYLRHCSDVWTRGQLRVVGLNMGCYWLALALIGRDACLLQNET